MDRPKFSEMLYERRRELGYSLGQASRVLRLREEVLVAFEEGNFDEMPKSGYAQGMISSYARYLGLDAGTVIEAYLADLEEHRRATRQRKGGRRSGSGGSYYDEQYEDPHRPRVPSRGLLPTSGGYAGDLGSFATTRVHTRPSEYSEDSSQRDQYPQGRPYTGKAPAYGSRHTSEGHRSAGDIQTLDMDYSQYNDDLSMEREAMPYEAASSARGRRKTRRPHNTGRPNVNRRSSKQRASRTTQSSNRNRDRRDGRSKSGLLDSPNVGLLIVGAIVLLFVVIMVVSISSCVSQGASPTRQVPVTTSSQSNNATEQKGGTDDKAQNATQVVESNATKAQTGVAASQGTTTTASEVNVSVSVSEGAVTWLEISNDGKSEVAETITGPWKKTYKVKDAITIQAGDTNSVTVLQDGKQVSFESMASGIGTIRIQGPGKSAVGQGTQSTNETSATTADDGASDEVTDSSTSGMAKMGNSSSLSTQSDEDVSEANGDAYGAYDYTDYVDYNGYSDTGYYDDYAESGY